MIELKKKKNLHNVKERIKYTFLHNKPWWFAC